MEQKCLFSTLVLGLAIGASGTAFAAKAVNLNQESFNYLKSQFNLSKTQQFVQSQSAAKSDLSVVKTRVDFNNTAHVRMQQTYGGVPVWGGDAIVHVKNANTNNGHTLLARGASSLTASGIKMNGVIYEGLDQDLANPDAKIFEKVEAEKALSHAIKGFDASKVSEKTSSLMVYVDDNQKAHWAYHISFLVKHDNAIPERPVMIVAADDFNNVFVKYNDIKTSKAEAKAIGFGGNNRVGEYQFGKDYPALDITRDAGKETCYMENADVKVVNLDGSYYGTKPMEFPCSDEALIAGSYWTGKNADGYDKINGSFSPSNDALYGGYVIKHMYNDWYGVPVLTNKDGSLMQLVMRVHYGYRYENAFWDGKQMTFGDGGSNMYPLVSLGVGAHEISHGFTEQHSNLAYYRQSGGLNESFSDMAAQAAEYYSTGESSWFIGERIMKDAESWPVLRYMETPSKDGRSIDSAKDYYNGLDVHYSSGVFNRLFFLMANNPGWDTKKAFNVMVKANEDYWTSNTTFDYAACGVLSAAADYNYDLESVQDAITKVGIDTSVCED